MAVAIVSPHFDDALFSVGGLVLKGGIPARVINVCGGNPGKSPQLSSWDARCGFGSADEAAASRICEDAKAWKDLPVECINLPYLDNPYSNGTPVEVISTSLRKHLVGVQAIWAPMAIGGHPDHTNSRDAALRLATDLDLDIYLYADAPYASARGWHTDDGYREVAFRWETAFGSLRQLGFELVSFESVSLTHGLMAEKLRRASAYRSQIAPLKTYYPAIDCPSGELSNEGLWSVRSLAMRSNELE